MLHKLLVVSLVALAASAAAAADLPTRKAPAAPLPPPPFSWTGPFVGGQIGWAWANDNTHVTAFDPGAPGSPGSPGIPPVLNPDCPNTCPPLVPGVPGVPGVAAIPPFLALDSLGVDTSGVIGGVHAGYNYQFGQWVIGVEGVIDVSDLRRTGYLAWGYSDGLNVPVQGALLGRLGFAVDRALIYATGGLGIASVSNNYFVGLIGPPTIIVNQKFSHTPVGWTIGAGFDYALDAHWTLGLQYRYSDFGHYTDTPFVFSNPAGGFLSVRHSLTENQVQFEIGYKFD